MHVKLNVHFFFIKRFILIIVWLLVYAEKHTHDQWHKSLTPYRELCPVLTDLIAQQCWGDGSLHPAFPKFPFTLRQWDWPIQHTSLGSTLGLICSIPGSNSSNWWNSLRRWGLTVSGWGASTYGRPPLDPRPVCWGGNWNKQSSHLRWLGLAFAAESTEGLWRWTQEHSHMSCPCLPVLKFLWFKLFLAWAMQGLSC